MADQKSYWIWNYGDYEIFHSNKINSRTETYGVPAPCSWKLYDVDRNVVFFCEFTAEKDGYMELFLNGRGSIDIDREKPGRTRYGVNEKIFLEKGEHTARLCVNNLHGLPAAYIKSDVCATDGSWYTLDCDNKKTPAGYEEYYDSSDKNPEIFPFEYKTLTPVEKTVLDDGVLFDFGKELFGFLVIKGVSENDKLHVSYGESKEEALDVDYSVIFEDVCGKSEYRLTQRAFRYIYIKGSKTAEAFADYEYLPLEYKGSFECNDESVNKIWDICAYTLHLTSREVQLEALKRDGWLWGGDAYQAYKFNNYVFFDRELVRRSTIALRGKEPVLEHINIITDYSFYWIIGLREYYLNYKDIDFIKFIYPRAVSLMEFASKRVNDDGFIAKKGNDWIFIDWSEFDKNGAMSAEQLLYISANRTMAYLSELLGIDGSEYSRIADEMTEKTNKFFWSDEKGAYIDTYESGKNNVTRHANIFAIIYGIATEEQKASIVKNVLLNDDITQITNPYFEGFELDAFGILGKQDYIENKIKTYWKGMLDLGATTVWEEYKPDAVGVEHYSMYNGKYHKSLCHAWGAAPIYLLGKYFLGVAPTSDGFDTFEVKPHLGGFEYIKGTVPINGGEVKVHLSKDTLSVVATKDGGSLVWDGKTYNLNANEEFCLKL